MHSEAIKGSFHDAIGPILKISQCFGILPVNNVNSKDISNIAFNWKSMKTIYSIIFIASGTVECVLAARMMLKQRISLGNSSALCFYVTSVIGAFCMLRLASKWNRLMRFWYDSEKVFLQPPYTVSGWPLKRKIFLWAGVYYALALRKSHQSATVL
jgi:gustatory receptor